MNKFLRGFEEKDEGGWPLSGVIWQTVEKDPIELGIYYETRGEGDALIQKITNSSIDPNDPRIHGEMYMSNNKKELRTTRWTNHGYFANPQCPNDHDIMRPSKKLNEILRKKKLCNLSLPTVT